jgi:hypothetical protein
MRPVRTSGAAPIRADCGVKHPDVACIAAKATAA